MAQVLVRNIEENVKIRLKARAIRHGCSLEEEVRQILRRAVNEDTLTSPSLGSRIAARFAGMGLAEPLPELRRQAARPMKLD